MSPRTVTLQQHFAVLLLNSSAVVVPSTKDAKTWLDEHHHTKASYIANLAQQIYARKSELGLSGHLRQVSEVQSTQLSFIREALVIIFTAVAADEAVICIDGAPEEVLFGDEHELAALML